MKKLSHLLFLFLTIALLLSPLLALSQKNEGIIQFEEKMNMHRNIPAEDAQMKSMIPEWRVTQSELLFNTNESLYRNKDEDEDDEINNGQGMVIKMQRPEAIYYRNFTKMQKTDAREFFGKHYLVVDSLTTGNWKLAMETKQILGYNCTKATTVDTVRKREIIAWFADALPLQTGPVSFGQLPGTILEVDINNGEIMLSAKKVEFKKLKKNDLVAPSKGDKITEAGFQKMMADQMKENGGRSMRIIRN